MGTLARVVLYAQGTDQAERAAAAAFRRIGELDSLLSDYRDDSEVSSLIAGAGGPPMPISDDLFAVLRQALELAEETHGAFDVTVGPLVLLWREARRQGQLPDSGALRSATGLVGWRHVTLDTVANTARLALAGMRLDLGGIAKGYAVDAALDELLGHGIERALVAIGGEIVAGRPPPGEHGWRITVAHHDAGPSEILLADAAVSSSGDTEQFVEIGGTRYSHVVDPRTGIGLTHRTAATVVAPSAVTADALSTAATILDDAERAAFIAAHPEASFHVRSLAENPGRAPSDTDKR
jgi:thiamine biosynthesis lipoprotein